MEVRARVYQPRVGFQTLNVLINGFFHQRNEWREDFTTLVFL